MILTALDQIKVLADPLRIKILEELNQERTTKQVAERIGEKPTRLYHHVEALEKVGLIELTRTRQNRGTLEKYYIAVARAFQADSRVFTGGGEASNEEKETLRSMVSLIFNTSSAELTDLIENSPPDCIEEEGILTFAEIRAGRKDLTELQRRLREILDWLTQLDDEDDKEDEKDQERYRLTIAYFPLDRKPPETDSGTTKP